MFELTLQRAAKMASTLIKLCLYVQPGNSGEALSRLYKALENHNYTDYQLEIIDITKEPNKAAMNGIFRTPTLIAETQDGNKNVCDNLSDIDKVRSIFGFKTAKW